MFPLPPRFPKIPASFRPADERIEIYMKEKETKKKKKIASRLQ